MNTRIARIAGVFAAAMFLVACGSKMVFNKAAYDGVKKVTIVHYAINPAMLVGAANVPDLQKQVADANVKAVAEKLSGLGFDITSLDEVKGNAAYQAFAAEQAGFIAPTGMRLPAATKAWDFNELPGPTAAQLCTALGVDAVIVATENWSTRQYGAYGISKALFNSQLNVQMFDKNGVAIWADRQAEVANDGLAMVGGILTSPDGVLTSATQSVAASLDVMRENLSKAKGAPAAK